MKALAWRSSRRASASLQCLLDNAGIQIWTQNYLGHLELNRANSAGITRDSFIAVKQLRWMAHHFRSTQLDQTASSTK